MWVKKPAPEVVRVCYPAARRLSLEFVARETLLQSRVRHCRLPHSRQAPDVVGPGTKMRHVQRSSPCYGRVNVEKESTSAECTIARCENGPILMFFLQNRHPPLKANLVALHILSREV